jgi:glutathione S-transferase
MTNLTVHGTPISTYVRTVRLLLEEAGANYKLNTVGILNGENNSADYLAKNPFGKVPALEVDGETLYETVAITDYLDTVLASNKFSPADPLRRAKMRQITSIIDGYLYAPAIRSIVIQRLIVPSQGGTTDEEAVKNSIAPAKKAVDAIEAITVGNPYLLGSEVSLADFHLIPIFVYLSKTPEFEAITADAPKIKTWWGQVTELPSVKKVCQ